MDSYELKEQIINNEFDYSNAIVDGKSILYLANTVNSIFQKMKAMFDEDEKKNEPLKWEYKNYEYKDKYSKLQYQVVFKNHARNEFQTYEALETAVESGNLNNVEKFTIELDLDYSRGKEGNLISLENNFKITFQPFEIKFIRKSNYNENLMQQVEDSINDCLNKFNILNTIFCTKEGD